MPKKYNDEQKECFERLFYDLNVMFRYQTPGQGGYAWSDNGISFMDVIEEFMERLKEAGGKNGNAEA